MRGGDCDVRVRGVVGEGEDLEIALLCRGFGFGVGGGLGGGFAE